MRKSVLALALAGVVLFTGCEDESSITSSVTESVQTTTTTETATVVQPVETTPVQQGGVSLMKDEYAQLKKLVKFDGEYTDISSLGYEIYEVDINSVAPDDTWVEYNELDGFSAPYISYLMSCDEMMYFERRTEDINTIALSEYNVQTGEMSDVLSFTETVDGSIWGVIYADKDYVIYRAGTNYLYDRTTGKTVEMPAEFDHNAMYSLCRCGSTFFFQGEKTMFVDKTEHGTPLECNISVPYLCRYYPKTNTFNVVEVGTRLWGCAQDRLICVQSDGQVKGYDPTGGWDFYPYTAPVNRLNMEDTAFPTYVHITERNKVLGNKSSAGFYLLPDYYVEAFTTGYNVTVQDLVVAEDGWVVAADIWDENNEHLMVIVDRKAKKVAQLFYDDYYFIRFIRASGKWLYFVQNFGRGNILAVNTEPKTE